MAPYNFSPASDRDAFVYGCHTPGYQGSGAEPQPGTLGKEALEGWADFMHEQGIKKVIILLHADEWEWYKPSLTELYEQAGFSSVWVPAKGPGAVDQILPVLQDAVSEQQKVVVHCSGGGGRVGTIFAAYLAKQYGLTYPQVAEEIKSVAEKYGVNRKAPKEERFNEFISGAGWGQA